MKVNPIPAFLFAVCWATWVALVTQAELGKTELPACENLIDFLSGCSNLFSIFLSFGILGTIPTAPVLVNSVMAIVGLAARGTILWAISEWRA